MLSLHKFAKRGQVESAIVHVTKSQEPRYACAIRCLIARYREGMVALAGLEYAKHFRCRLSDHVQYVLHT